MGLIGRGVKYTSYGWWVKSPGQTSWSRLLAEVRVRIPTEATWFWASFWIPSAADATLSSDANMFLILGLIVYYHLLTELQRYKTTKILKYLQTLKYIQSYWNIYKETEIFTEIMKYIQRYWNIYGDTEILLLWINSSIRHFAQSSDVNGYCHSDTVSCLAQSNI